MEDNSLRTNRQKIPGVNTLISGESMKLNTVFASHLEH